MIANTSNDLSTFSKLINSTDSTLKYYYYENNSNITMPLSCSFNLSGGIEIYIAEFKENLKELIINDNQFKSNLLEGKYLTSNGNINTYINDNLCVTDYFEIDKNFDYYFESSFDFNRSNDVRSLCYYDENKNYISGYQYERYTNEIILQIPNNAKYFRATVDINQNYSLSTKKENFQNLIYKKFVENNKEKDEFINNLFSGFLKFGVIGDSLASGESVSNETGTNAFHDNYNYSWGQFIAKKTGTQCINFSAGGLTTRSWLTYSQGLQKLLLPENKCNCYIIGLGVNDYSKLGTSYIGTSADIHEDFTTNADTFYGNYGKIIGYIKQVQPKAKIFILTMPNTSSVAENFNNAIRTISNIFDNVYLIDLKNDYLKYYNSGFINNQSRVGHFNAIGYSYMANLLLDIFNNYMFNNYNEFSQIEFIGTNYSYT